MNRKEARIHLTLVIAEINCVSSAPTGGELRYLT